MTWSRISSSAVIFSFLSFHQFTVLIRLPKRFIGRAQFITAYPHTRPIRKASVLSSASHVSQYTFARSSTVPYQQSSEAASVGESSTASTSMLVNINCKCLCPQLRLRFLTRYAVYLKNATVGRDISPNDTKLLVLFRRNSKEITSQSTQWNDDHSAVWNENIPIQTSLLPNMHTESNISSTASERVRHCARSSSKSFGCCGVFIRFR